MDKKRLSGALVALYELVSRLRGPDGCPWDAQQTDSTVKMYLLEEAYEVLDALERGSPEDLCDELGDLLFQIIFLSRLAEERGEFDFEKVIEKITRKMQDRHPHVFGETRVRGAEEVADNWQRLKRGEKDSNETPVSLLQRVPEALPALLRAHRLAERASGLDFERPGKGRGWTEAEREFEELKKRILERDEEGLGRYIGRLLFSLANLARARGCNAENLLREANQRFIEGFREKED